MQTSMTRYPLLSISDFTVHAQLIVIFCILSVITSTSTEIMSERSGSITIRDLQDVQTPFGVYLSGIYKRSFAYITIKDRLPVILTRIIDTMSRSKEDIAQQYGQDALEEVKRMVGFISKLKNELVTNKCIKPLKILPNVTNNDADKWNKYLEERTEIEGGTPTWFNTIWLYCECYMYRTLAQELASMKLLHSYDPFEKQKHSAFINSLTSIQALSAHVVNLTNTIDTLSVAESRDECIRLLKLNLWGNKCDLSLSAGAEINQSSNPIEVLDSLDKDILVDNSTAVWDLLRKREFNETVIIDMVLDNAGYELFTDICLAIYLTARKLVSQIRFYVKHYPWYVSDTTRNDFYWTLEYMNNSSSKELQEIAKLSYDHLKNNVWIVEEELYWTGPYDFADMRKHDKSLYAKLSAATLVIFKGDLNYRKLLGDINWEYTTEFIQSLRGFDPSNILSLRTVKSDVCVGLPSGIAETLFEKDEGWMYTGQYGLIQMNTASTCDCSDRIC